MFETGFFKTYPIPRPKQILHGERRGEFETVPRERRNLRFQSKVSGSGASSHPHHRRHDRDPQYQSYNDRQTHGDAFATASIASLTTFSAFHGMKWSLVSSSTIFTIVFAGIVSRMY